MGGFSKTPDCVRVCVCVCVCVCASVCVPSEVLGEKALSFTKPQSITAAKGQSCTDCESVTISFLSLSITLTVFDSHHSDGSLGNVSCHDYLV